VGSLGGGSGSAGLEGGGSAGEGRSSAAPRTSATGSARLPTLRSPTPPSATLWTTTAIRGPGGERLEVLLGHAGVAPPRCRRGDARGPRTRRRFAQDRSLRVLREVGVVEVREDGRRRLYRLNGRALKPIHDWVKAYEDSWSERLDQLDAVLEDLKRKD
jgi:hypothetical protein